MSQKESHGWGLHLPLFSSESPPSKGPGIVTGVSVLAFYKVKENDLYVLRILLECSCVLLTLLTRW